MGRLLAVTSGKGGVGKSSVAVNLAEALSDLGNKVLLIDLDAGMRCLDLLLGVSDSLVFDLNDILENNAALGDVVLGSKKYQNLFLVPAPLSGEINPQKFGSFLNELPENFDFIILDFPAGGVNSLYKVLPKYTEALVVCNADAVSVRDAELVGSDLRALNIISVRLILNKADFSHIKQGITANIDEVIDRCAIRLLAVIPQSLDIYYSACTGNPINKKSKAYKAYSRLAKRILGYDVPLQYKKI